MHTTYAFYIAVICLRNPGCGRRSVGRRIGQRRLQRLREARPRRSPERFTPAPGGDLATLTSSPALQGRPRAFAHNRGDTASGLTSHTVDVPIHVNGGRFTPRPGRSERSLGCDQRILRPPGDRWVTVSTRAALHLADPPADSQMSVTRRRDAGARGPRRRALRSLDPSSGLADPPTVVRSA